MAFAHAYTFEELARSATTRTGPLALPVADTARPLSAQVGREIVQVLVSDIKKRFLSGTSPDGVKWKPLKFNRPSGPGQPLKDSGRLMSSITGKVVGNAVVVGTNHVAASLMNFGGEVRPKKGKFLAIPLTLAAKRAGSPRRIRGTPSMPTFARKGPTGKMVGHFLLVKKVTVPARPFLGISKQAEQAAANVLLDGVARQWQTGR